MLKRLVIALLCLVAIGFVAQRSGWLRWGPRYANLPPRGGTAWVALGDSLTEGFGAEQGLDYPTQLSQRLGVPIVNSGRSGDTTADGLARLSEVLALDPRVVMLCLGGNDTLQRVPPAQTFGNLATMIDRLHGRGAFVVVIGVRSASVLDQYRSRFADLAKARRVLLVPDVLEGVLGNPERMSDTIHPNAEGYRVIAARIEGALTPWLSQLQ